MSTDQGLGLFCGVDARLIGAVNLVLICLRDGPRERSVTVRWLRFNSGVTGFTSAADCLNLSQRFGIACELEDGQIGLTPFGLELREDSDSPPFNRFSDRQAELLLYHLLAEPWFGDVASNLLRRFTRRTDGSRELLLSMQRLTYVEQDCLVALQLLGTLRFQEGVLFASAEDYERFSELLGIMRVARSEADLDEQLALQRQRGKTAEEYVVSLERERLEREDSPELARLVDRVAEWDVGAGYDVKSYGPDGKERYIEVKSSTGSEMRFYLTLNEWQFMERHRDSSWLYFVSESHLLPTQNKPILAIADPWSWLRCSDMHATEWAIWIHQSPVIGDYDQDQITVLTR